MNQNPYQKNYNSDPNCLNLQKLAEMNRTCNNNNNNNRYIHEIERESWAVTPLYIYVILQNPKLKNLIMFFGRDDSLILCNLILFYFILTLTPPLGIAGLEIQSEEFLHLFPINDLEEFKLPYSSLASHHSPRLPRRRRARQRRRNLVLGAGRRPAGAAAGFCICGLAFAGLDLDRRQGSLTEFKICRHDDRSSERKKKKKKKKREKKWRRLRFLGVFFCVGIYELRKKEKERERKRALEGKRERERERERGRWEVFLFIRILSSIFFFL